MRYMKSILVVPAILGTAMWSGCGSTTTTAAPASSVLANSNTANTNVRKTVTPVVKTPVAKTPEPTPVAKATIGAEHEAGVAALKKHGITVSTKDMDVNSDDAKHLVVLGKTDKDSAEYKVAISHFMFRNMSKPAQKIMAKAMEIQLAFNSLTADELKSVLIASGVTSVADLEEKVVVDAIMTASFAKHGVDYNITEQRSVNNVRNAKTLAARRLATAVVIARFHAGSTEEKVAALLNLVGVEALESETMKSFAVQAVGGALKNGRLLVAFIEALVELKREKILADLSCEVAYVNAEVETALTNVVNLVDAKKNMKELTKECGRLMGKKAEYFALLTKNGVDVEYVAALTPVVVDMVATVAGKPTEAQEKAFVTDAKAAVEGANKDFLAAHNIDPKKFATLKVGEVLKKAILGSGIEQVDSERIVRLAGPKVVEPEMKAATADIQ